MRSEEEMVKKVRCVFYPNLECSVRAEMEKESSIRKIIRPSLKKLSDEEQMTAKLGDALSKIFDLRWSTLSSFCHICQKKVMEDLKYGETAEKLEIEEARAR